MDSQQPKSIALAVTAVLFLALGAGAGAIWMNRYKDQVEADRQEREEEERKKKFEATPPANPMPPDPRGPVGAGAPGGARPGGVAPPNLSGLGNRAPSPKMQLAMLVNKLDVLTRKPLTINLNTDQRAKLAEQIKGLLEQEELSDDDAKKRLEAALDVVKAEKETLEAAGYFWPGQRSGDRSREAPKNPFKDEANGKHLKSFQELLQKSTTN